MVFVPGESERIRRCRLQKEMRGEREKGGGGGGILDEFNAHSAVKVATGRNTIHQIASESPTETDANRRTERQTGCYSL